MACTEARGGAPDHGAEIGRHKYPPSSSSGYWLFTIAKGGTAAVLSTGSARLWCSTSCGQSGRDIGHHKCPTSALRLDGATRDDRRCSGVPGAGAPPGSMKLGGRQHLHAVAPVERRLQAYEYFRGHGLTVIADSTLGGAADVQPVGGAARPEEGYPHTLPPVWPPVEQRPKSSTVMACIGQ